ncbi:hypothetical protein [Sphingosinicella sp. BN140058]|uniref:hypothetical protein n=1 Tax=Sphingosinicella sp. BN140058 TaxID=1892855 RepID=UPI0010130CB8|nr:hypothetical protein [Sphingosinicella sp. BN140058]QAY78570.1 hypothetical protein ETR14_20010 [Sphingosinicella sp. BN140058]
MMVGAKRWVVRVAAAGLGVLVAILIGSTPAEIGFAKPRGGPSGSAVDSDAPAGMSAARDWLGTYEGRFEGAKGTIEISAAEGDRIAVNLVIGAPGCSGSLTLDAPAPTSDRLVLTTADEFTEDVCTITLVRHGRVIETLEDRCLASHGMQCTFTGRAKRKTAGA